MKWNRWNVRVPESSMTDIIIKRQSASIFSVNEGDCGFLSALERPEIKERYMTYAITLPPSIANKR